MGALIGWLIILSVFGGILYAIARIEGFWVTLGMFAGAVAGTILLCAAVALIQ